jgi:4-hydroxy-3-methylbut-2-enyl diphosphate reductase
VKSPSTSGEKRLPAPVFRKGLNLKHAVAGALATDYHSQLIDEIKSSNFTWTSGRLVVHLATEFGFCYGVDRAVDYAYQTRARFPDRQVYLTGEIIHNPQVNNLLRRAGVAFLSDPGQSVEQVDAADVVILPAFGVTVEALQQLDRQGCTLIDTTCGSVLNVWKAVKRYTKDGFTAVIHGKVHHEETQATASQALTAENGRYLIILDDEEAMLVCDLIRGRASVDQFLAAFGEACSPGFDPVADLRRVGLANQTTMLMSESLRIGEMIRLAMIDQYGQDAVGDHYRAFETICSATQDRQDAVNTLLSDQRFDFAVVIGGYNSSNTRNLARICAERLPTFHIADADCLVSDNDIRHRPAGAPPPGATGNVPEVASHDWLPTEGLVHVAVTAGASTPDNIVGDVISRLARFANASYGKFEPG